MTDDSSLDDLMTLDEAIERFPIFRRNELLVAMRAGELRHLPKGRKRFVTEEWLKEYVRGHVYGGRGPVSYA